jgi:hypothetical protein
LRSTGGEGVPDGGAAERPLLCPACAAEHPPEERFCASCGMPLVLPGDPAAAEVPASESHARARKVRPEYARGELVRVTGGRNQAEAELIHGFLLEEGIPSLVRRSAAFDVPDFLAAGQRDILVPESGAPAARELLLEAELATARPPGMTAPEPGARAVLGARALRLAAAIVAGGLVAALVAWALAALGS